jgi:hypothetical protein
MKIHALLAVLVLAAPATTFADRKSNRGHSSHRGHSHSSHRGHSHHGHRHSSFGGIFSRSYYSSPRYYSSGYYGGYGYGSSFGYYSRPAVVLSYSSTPRYESVSRYDDGDSLEMDVQQALRRRGYYRGAVDGDIGPGSRAAIRTYQADHGLTVNGRIDSGLLRSLRL